MQTIHVISHTHWDREWYKTFQQFRLQLVHLVDNLFSILENDPTYLHFMLDGQTIVLEDYLQVRMANLPLLQKYVQENRILIGPWYILPDEYLVSPEATIRNLMIGKQICALFGQRMMIGYIPDPFGHIAQLPQIFNGFHMDTACLWRGVPVDTPTVVHWEAPDGSRVLLAHLYDGYGNIAEWPAADIDQSLLDLDKKADKLQPFNPTDHFLMMRGTDHLEPRPQLPEHIRYYNQHNASNRQAIHSTLPAYFAAISEQIETENIALRTIKGELRDPQKAHMLPGVYSARMWIKQGNHLAETMLERWVEPFSTWAELLKRGQDAFLPIKDPEKTTRLNDPGAIIHQAWKLLITNHPHDSICGCSIDETHADMVSRFDQVNQISEAITGQSLLAIISETDTTGPELPEKQVAVTVFNASPYPKTDLVSVSVEVPDQAGSLGVYDQDGVEVPSTFEIGDRELKESNTYPISQLMDLLTATSAQGHNNQTLVRASLGQDPDMQVINAELSSHLPADYDNLGEAFTQLTELMSTADPDMLIRVKVFNVPTARLAFIANDVPAAGFKTWWVGTKPEEEELGFYDDEEDQINESISNEFFTLTLTGEDGSFALYDKLNHVEYQDLNAFTDRGDRGDEYNYTPPENDQAFKPELQSVETYKNELEELMILRMNFNLPIGLTTARDSRSDELAYCLLDVAITLTKGVPQVGVQVIFDNQVLDHRLEVRFPTGLMVDHARFDSHFQIIERPIDLPSFDRTWQEYPRPEVPQRAFCDISTAECGLTIANRGLPEVAVVRDDEGKAVIALTLLRCVGWLSRDDLWNRRGQAGPPLPTPGAQELVTYMFHFAIIPHGPDFGQAVQQAQSFQTDLSAYVSPIKAGKLATTSSIFEITPAEFMVTAVKEAENEAGWILRGVNLADHTIDLKLKTPLPFKTVSLVHLDESHQVDIELNADGELNLPVPAHKIVSIFFKVAD